MRDEAVLRPLIVLDELNAIVGQHRVDLVGNGIEESLEKAGSDELRRLPVDPGEDQLGGPVDGYEQIGLAALVAQFGDVAVKIAALVSLESFGLPAIRLRQEGNPVTPYAAHQGRPRHMSCDVL